MAFVAPVAAEGAILAAPEIAAAGAAGSEALGAAGTAAAEGAEALGAAAEKGVTSEAKSLAKMAGAAAAPIVAKKFGEGAAKKLTPLAEKGIHSILTSKSLHEKLGSAGHKVGNALFGKYHKTARDIGRKAGHVAGMAFSPEAHNVLKTGLDIGQEMGFLDKHQAKNIISKHKTGMKAHDALSKFNKIHQQLKPKSDKSQMTHKTDPNPRMSALKEAMNRPQAPRPPRERHSGMIDTHNKTLHPINPMGVKSQASDKGGAQDIRRSKYKSKSRRPPPMPARDY